MVMFKHWYFKYKGVYIGISMLSCFLFGTSFGIDWKRTVELYLGPIYIEIIWGSKD